MKKYIIFIMIAVAAMAISSCQKEISPLSPDTETRTHMVTLNVSDQETRTGVIAVPGGYLSTWYIDDYIYLYEYNPNREGEVVKEYQSASLQESDIVDGKASFTVELETDEASEDTYSYIALYSRYPWAYEMYWEDAEDYSYTEWSSLFDYTGEYLDPHMVAEFNFQIEQCPLSTSFDPNADVLLSQVLETTGQLEGDVTLKFARLGTIVKITLTDLDEYIGQPIINAEFVPGQSFNKSTSAIYDTILGEYVHMQMSDPMDDMMEMGRTIFRIYPQDVVVKEDGTADIWLRTYAGELTDEFSFTLFFEDEEYNQITLTRHIDLAAEKRVIEFNEGGMTVFSIGGWLLADVESVYCKTVVNEAMDGFTAVWDAVENAVGYDCYLTGYAGEWDENGEPEVKYDKTPLTPVDNGDGTWSITVESGLEPMNYTLHIKPIPAEGHALIYDDYDYFEMKIGLPDVWYFYHDNFGNSSSCEYIEGTDGEYIIDFSPGKVRYKNLQRYYDQAWQALSASGPWYMYSTEPLKRMHSIELYSKDDSHLALKVYASSTPNEHTKELAGTVIETKDIEAGNPGSSSYYKATHKMVRYTFPEDETYQYYTICGEEEGIVMTSQVTYVYYFK